MLHISLHVVSAIRCCPCPNMCVCMYACVCVCVSAPPSLLWHSQPFSGPVWLAVGMVAMTTTSTSPCRTNNGRHRWEQVDHVNTHTRTHSTDFCIRSTYDNGNSGLYPTAACVSSSVDVFLPVRRSVFQISNRHVARGRTIGFGKVLIFYGHFGAESYFRFFFLF